MQREHVGRRTAETSGDFCARFFAGCHFFIDTARTEVLAALAEDLVRCLSPRQTQYEA